MKVILASQSVRRRKILENLGIIFESISADADEKNVPDVTPGELVQGLAVRKLRAALEKVGTDDLVICADTVVAFEGKILGKPRDRANAVEMLTMLSGASHEVYTGVAIYADGRISVDSEVTRVRFRDLTADEIERYVDSGEPMDKAGSYGIQDTAGIFVEGIDGDFFNVVGLPVCKMTMMLKNDLNINITDLMYRKGR